MTNLHEYSLTNTTMGGRIVIIKLKKLASNPWFTIPVTLLILYICGGLHMILEKSYSQFSYPVDEDISLYVEELKEHKIPSRSVINHYNYEYIHKPYDKCKENERLRLVFIVKSAIDHFERRTSIRRTWGNEKRFADVEIRTVFTLGVRDDDKEQQRVNREVGEHNDIIQANFLDKYFNNTIKTMLSFKWVVTDCPNSDFYMFVDDDFLVSTKNLLSYLRSPTTYPPGSYSQSLIDSLESVSNYRFYSGYCIPARPQRVIFSKWYLSLSEYKYSRFPLYATAGAYMLSFDALIDLYYASFYTQHFRFDDVYLGILALKTGITPVHTKYVLLFPLQYTPKDYKDLIAVHGFDDNAAMELVWRNQRELGYA